MPVNNSRKIVGRIIKNKRKKNGLTQEEFAGKLNTVRQYICKIEKGKINMTLDYLDKVIKKLNCKHKDFFNDNKN